MAEDYLCSSSYSGDVISKNSFYIALETGI